MEVQRNTYLTKIINRMHNGMIKVITGIRRSGKSYLLLTLFRKHLHKIGVREDHILVMEFDRFENRQYRDPYVLLDYLKNRLRMMVTIIFCWMKFRCFIILKKYLIH